MEVNLEAGEWMVVSHYLVQVNVQFLEEVGFFCCRFHA